MKGKTSKRSMAHIASVNPPAIHAGKTSMYVSSLQKEKHMVPANPIQHVVIIVKENHAFDNYFGKFPGCEGDPTLGTRPVPPNVSPRHEHQAWLERADHAVHEQYTKDDITSYFAYAKQFTLCDHYFTDVAGPSTPNHLMLIAADSPLINNPHHRDRIELQPPFDLPSLPSRLEGAGLTGATTVGMPFASSRAYGNIM